MTKEIVSDGAPFEIVALDRQTGGRQTTILKASVAQDGTASVEIPADLSLTGKVSTKAVATTGNVAATVDVTAGRDAVATRDVTAGRNVAATGTVTGAGITSTGNLGAGVDVVAGRDVTAVRKMTVNGALVLAGNPFHKLVSLGSNGVGPVVFAGVKQGDLVLCAINLTDLTDVSDKFENPISDPGNIGQIAADNLSAKTILFLVIAQS